MNVTTNDWEGLKIRVQTTQNKNSQKYHEVLIQRTVDIYGVTTTKKGFKLQSPQKAGDGRGNFANTGTSLIESYGRKRQLR